MDTGIGVDIDIDKQSLDKLNDALLKLPERLRRRRILAAQKKAIKPVRQAAQDAAKQMTKSESLAESIEVQVGRYGRDEFGNIYVVVTHGKKVYKKVRYLGKYAIPYNANYMKTAHLVVMGTQGGLRRAGTRNRREKRKGQIYERTQATKGQNFVVRSRGGQYHKIKQIKHPGAEPNPYFDKAYNYKMKEAQMKFSKDVINDLNRYIKRRGLA